MKLCIIGGGTTGWWAAAYFENQFPDYEITLIESNEIATIGVGESTLPQIGTFLNDCGLQDTDWMDESNAVIKYGNIKQFWDHETDSEQMDWTFWYNDNNEFDEWVKEYKSGNKNKQDMKTDLYKMSGRRATAYHLDANLAGIVVKNHCKRVNHIVATLDTLPEGYDLYIDCTGFARKFIKDKSTIKPSGHLVNSAWVCPKTIPEGYNINFTQSIARPYGWQFKVALQHRIGTGYVYNNNMLSDDQALQDFVSWTKDLEPFNNIPPRKLSWTPEYLENPWEDNVVAIGLSSGWVDPLEANGLFVTVYGIQLLGNCLKRGLSQKAYNRSMRRLWKENCDFIWHHYALTKRNDTPFWQYYSQQSASESVWHNYKTKGNWKTNFYSDALWAMLGVMYDDFEFYQPKK